MLQENTILVSIIICFFNEENFLRSSIKSVLEQEYKNWELILVDDGSTDSSTSIAKEYVSEYPDKIVYYDHDLHSNKGLSASRNLGIYKCNGDVICFLDADDYFLPVKLSAQVALLSKYPMADLVYGPSIYLHSQDDGNEFGYLRPVGAESERYYFPPELQLRLYPLNKGASPCIHSFLVKKSAILKFGGFEDSYTSLYEDQVFLSKMYLNATIYSSSIAYSVYRQRKDSMLHSIPADKYQAIRIQYLNWLKNYMGENKMNFPEVSKMVKTLLFQYSTRFRLMTELKRRWSMIIHRSHTS